MVNKNNMDGTAQAIHETDYEQFSYRLGLLINNWVFLIGCDDSDDLKDKSKETRLLPHIPVASTDVYLIA